MTVTLLFFFMEAVVMRGADCLALGNPVRGPSSALSFACPSSSRASYLLRKGTWGGQGGWQGNLLKDIDEQWV